MSNSANVADLPMARLMLERFNAIIANMDDNDLCKSQLKTERAAYVRRVEELEKTLTEAPQVFVFVFI